MSLVRYQTRSPFGLFREFEKVFGNDLTFFPVDVLENNDSYIIKANLPGVSKDDIEIEANHEYIDIKASLEKSSGDEEIKVENDDEKYLIRERQVTKFHRRFNFRKPINSKEAVVSLEDGVLTITLPKAEEGKSVKLTIN